MCTNCGGEAAHGHWWMLHRWVMEEWVNMGAFVSASNMFAQTAPLFADVKDVAIPIDPVHDMFLVVEDGLSFDSESCMGQTWV